MSGIKRRNDCDEGDVAWVEDLATTGKMRKKDQAESLVKSPEESPRRVCDQDPDGARENGRREEEDGPVEAQQSLAAQLQDVKSSAPAAGGAATIKEQLKRVFEKLRLQVVEEFLEGNDPVDAMKLQYHAILQMQENRHFDEKRGLVEFHLLKLSALEVQLIEAQNRCDDLVQLQNVLEADHVVQMDDLRKQLERLSTKNAEREEYENLTDALADLDAALEKESDRLLASEHIANGAEEEKEEEEKEEEEKGGGTSKVEELEKQCKCLESQLDEVKVEIVKIVLENEELRLEVKRLEREKNTSADVVEEKVQFETELLQQRIKQLVHSSEQDRQHYISDRNAIDEDRKDLESRLELLRTEFDRLDDYWQMKIDSERELHEEERESTLLTYDEKFKALEMKIKEYEELLLSQGDGESTTSSLSTIEERSNWEKQLNDLEEEAELHLRQIANLQSQLEADGEAHTKEIQRLTEERDNYLEDVDALKSLLAEAVEREGRLSSASSVRSTRPVSPSHDIVLPSGYCPLKSKGWAKTQRNATIPTALKVPNPTPDGPDAAKCNQAGSSSSSSSSQDNHSRGHRLDISVFHALNDRIKQQELRCRQTCYALKMQKQRTEQILLDSRNQHEEEIKSLELMMKSAQETMLQMSLKQKQTMEKLAASDNLIMQLYTENSQLLQALQLQSLAPT